MASAPGGRELMSARADRRRRRYVSVLAMLAMLMGAGVAALALPPAASAATPLQITTTSIPPAVTNHAYSFQMQASGGAAPYSWQAGGLPSGFSMSAGGLITGKPSLPEQTHIEVVVTDATGTSAGAYLAFTVSSGVPQLDPTLFQLSNLLSTSPYDNPVLSLVFGVLCDAWQLTSSVPDPGLCGF